MFREIPVLPVVVPLAGLVFLALVAHLHRMRLLTAPRVAVALALCVYVAGVVANTVFPIYLDKPPSDGGWYVNIVPLVDYEVADAVMNVAVFVPVGVLVSLVLVTGSAWRVLAVAAGASLTIEVTQLVTGQLLGGGHVADVNDLLFNVLGAAAGVALTSLVARVPGGAALVDRFRWR